MAHPKLDSRPLLDALAKALKIDRPVLGISLDVRFDAVPTAKIEYILTDEDTSRLAESLATLEAPHFPI